MSVLFPGLARLGLWLLLALIFTRGVSAAADRQSWTDFRIGGQAGELAWKFEEELIAVDDMSNLNYLHSDLGASVPVRSWLAIDVNFREISQETGEDWEQEHRPHTSATFKWRPAGWELADRNRIEYRVFEHGDDQWRYRNRLALFAPPVCLSANLRPYLAEEVFCNLAPDDGIQQRRFSAGITARIGNHFRPELAYVRMDRDTGDGWSGTDVLYAVLEFVL